MRAVLAVVPVLALLAFAPNLAVLTVGWTAAIGVATYATWRRGRSRRAVRQAAWHALLIPLLPALAIVAGVDSTWFAIDVTSAVAFVIAGLLISTRAARRDRDGVMAAAAAVVALRVWLAAGEPWPMQLVAGAATFGLLSSGWRVAAIIDIGRHRMRSRRRALSAWRAIDSRGLDMAAAGAAHLVEAWSTLLARAVPISVAEESRLVLGGLVIGVAYLLWAQ